MGKDIKIKDMWPESYVWRFHDYLVTISKSPDGPVFNFVNMQMAHANGFIRLRNLEKYPRLTILFSFGSFFEDYVSINLILKGGEKKAY